MRLQQGENLGERVHTLTRSQTWLQEWLPDRITHRDRILFLALSYGLGLRLCLTAFHPLTIAAHYRLWNRKGRSKKVTDGASSPYATREELITSLLSALLATMVAAYLGTH